MATLTVAEMLRQAKEVSGMSLSEMAEFADKADRAAIRIAQERYIATRPDGSAVFRRPTTAGIG